MNKEDYRKIVIARLNEISKITNDICIANTVLLTINFLALFCILVVLIMK